MMYQVMEPLDVDVLVKWGAPAKNLGRIPVGIVVREIGSDDETIRLEAHFDGETVYFGLRRKDAEKKLSRIEPGAARSE